MCSDTYMNMQLAQWRTDLLAAVSCDPKKFITNKNVSGLSKTQKSYKDVSGWM